MKEITKFQVPTTPTFRREMRRFHELRLSCKWWGKDSGRKFWLAPGSWNFEQLAAWCATGSIKEVEVLVITNSLIRPSNLAALQGLIEAGIELEVEVEITFHSRFDQGVAQ